MPGADLVRWVQDPHARIVQDETSTQTVASDGARGSELSTLAALIVFSFVSAGTPGPNNVVLWASGAQFGFRRTLPHVMGTAIGIGALAVAVAAGLGALVTAVPATQLILKATGSVYLIYLAYQIAISRAMQGQQVARPLSLGQAIVFQWLNPKGWIFVLSAVSAFRPRELPIAVGSALVIVTMMLVVIPAAAAWAAGGSLISRLTTSDRAHRALSIGLAVLLAVSILQLWI
jgi:threonine/homoserine/homoserine lactone efflux protein